MLKKKHLVKLFKQTTIALVAIATISWSFCAPLGGLFPVKEAQAAAPFVQEVYWAGPTAVVIVFDQAMDETSAETTTNYTIVTAAAADNSTVTSASLQVYDSVERVVVLTASGAVISPSPSDTVTVSSNVKNTSAEAQSDTMPFSPMMPMSDNVLISERSYQFIELYNKSNSAVSLNGWKLTQINASGSTNLITFDVTHSIPAYGFFLVTSTDATNGYEAKKTECSYPTVTADASTAVDLETVDSAIILYDNSSDPIDVVGWGNSPIKEGDAYGWNFATGSGTNPGGCQGIERKAEPASSESSLRTGGSPDQSTWGNAYDSNNNEYDFVLHTGTTTSPEPQTTGSATEQPFGGESGYTSGSPGIMHMSIFQAIDNADLVAIADIMDPETTPKDLTAQLKYSPDGGTTWATATGTFITGSFFKFIVAQTSLNATNDLKYYLKATDADGNSTCFASGSMPGACGDESSFKTNAFTIDIIANGTVTWNKSIAGTVRDGSNADPSSAPIANALVFIEGSGWNTVSASNGTFTLSNIAQGTYPITAIAPGFMSGRLDGIPSSSSGLYFDLWPGSIGGGGEMGSGGVMWTAPGDGMMGAPTDISSSAAPILVAFTEAMDSSTINTTNVKFWKINPLDGSTSAPGISYSVSYDSGLQFGPDAKVIISSPTQLSSNTSYEVELTPGVTNTAGNPLSGNRPGGGHLLMFTTSGGMDYMDNMMTMMEGNSSNFETMMAGKFGAGTDYADMDSLMNTMQGNTGMFQEMMHGTGGQFMPPYVDSTIPSPGSFGVPKESKILIKFSEPMNESSITSGTYIKLYEVNADGSTGSAIAVSISLDTKTKTMATIDPASDLEAKKYRLDILGGAQGSSGMMIGPPGQETSTFFTLNFESSGTADTTGPTVDGTNLEMYTWDSTNAKYTGIPTNMIFELGFSEALDESTVNTNTITLAVGSSKATTTVTYNPGGNTILIAPSAALSAGTTYTLTVTASVQDLAGKPISYTTSNTSGTQWTKNFITGSVDIAAPSLEFIDADDYSATITFSEPMNSAKVTDANKWPTSVLNPGNYTIKSGGGDDSSTWPSITFSKATLSYEAAFNVVNIEGIYYIGGSCTADNPCPLIAGEGIKLIIGGNGVADISGNVLAAGASTQGTVLSSQDTYGMLGPMGGGMMGPGMGGTVGFGGHDPTMMMEMPVGVMPMNQIAGKTTLYFVDFPTSKALQDGDIIVLTFPQGFDVSGAKQDAYSPMNSDMNGPGTGTVTFDAAYDDSGGDDSVKNDGILANKTARTVKIKLDISGVSQLPAQDFLHLDIDGIKNSVTPKDWSTSGYTVNMKSMRGTQVLESMTSMPFFITKGGDYIISGTVTATGVDNGQTIRLKMESPMGPQDPDSTVTFSGGSASYSFGNLTQGYYHLMVEPVVTLKVSTADTDFFSPMPRPLNVPDDISESGYSYSAGTKTLTYNFSLTDASTGTALTVKLTGDFDGEDVDIFAGSSQGFIVKTISSVGNVTNDPHTIYLPSDGIWNIGIGPAMSKGFGPMMGPPPMPSWMPPPSQEVVVSSSAITKPASGIVTFAITTFTEEIIGYVQDASGNMIKGVEVYTHKTSGEFGMPSHTTSGRDENNSGKFTLKVGTGMYAIGAFLPGLPSVPEIKVLVKDNSDSTDGNTASDVYLEGNDTSSMLVTDANRLIIRLQKTSYLIEGYLYDSPESDAQVVSYAPVWAQSVSTGEMAPGGTDERGKYSLFVRGSESGINWKVFAHIPGMGDIAPTTVTVKDDSTVCTSKICTVDLNPGIKLADMAEIKGRVFVSSDASYNAGEEITDANVWIDGQDSSGNFFGNGGPVDQVGRYSFRAPSGSNFKVHAWTGDYGELPENNLGTVAAGTTYTVDFRVNSGALQTVSISFGTVTGVLDGLEGFVDVFDPSTSKGNHIRIADVASVASHETLNLADGTNYFANAFIPGFGEFEANEADAATHKVTIDSSNTSLSFTLPSSGNLITLSGTVTITGTVTPVSEAFVWIDREGTSEKKGLHFGDMTDSNGAYSINLEKGTYNIGVDAPGYTSPAPVSQTLSGDTTKNFSLVANSNSISGTIYSDVAETTKIEQGWIWAERVTSATDLTASTAGGWTSTPINGGQYKVSVGEGYWVVHAVSDGYVENYTTAQCVGTGCDTANPTGVNLVLTAISGYVPKTPAVKNITPAAGGVLDDTANSGVKVIIPPNAIRTTDQISNTTTLQLIIKESTAVIQSKSQIPLEDVTTGEKKIINISIIEPNTGTQIKSFDKPITIEYHYSEDDLPAGVSEESLTFNSIDTSSGQFTNYNGDTGSGITYIVDTVNNIIRAQTDHLSDFGPTTPPPGSPTAPSGLSATAASSSQINLSWTDNSDNESGFKVYGNSADSNWDSSATLITTTSADATSYPNTGLSASTAYYYRLKATNASGDSNWTSTASATTRSAGGAVALPSGPSTPPTEEEEEEVAVGEEEEEEEEEEVIGIEEITIPSLEKPVSQMTPEELQAKIKEFLTAIQQLQTLLDQLTLEISGIPSGYTFENNLKTGMESNEVKYLQIFLNSNADTMLAESGVGSSGEETNYFGPLTKAAVIKFQEKYAEDVLASWGLIKGTGFFGQTTRTKINELLGG